MKVIDNRTTGKNKNKNQITNIIYEQKNYNKIKLASDKAQKKQTNLHFIRKDMGPVLNATG